MKSIKSVCCYTITTHTYVRSYEKMLEEQWFSLRIDGERSDQALIDWIKEEFDSYLITHEYGEVTEKPHFHAMVRMYENKRRKTADRLLAAFPRLKGLGKGAKGKYALAVARHEDALQKYILKGTKDKEADVVACNWIELPDYANERKEYWSMEAERSKKESTLCGRAMNWWHGHQIWNDSDITDGQARLKVAQWLIDDCVREKRPINKNYLRSIVHTVVAGNQDSKKTEYLVYDIADADKAW